MELGKRIAYYRKNKNITQDALAKQLGISNQAVSKWETDQSCPDVELLPKIADIFEITLDELFERVSLGQEGSEDVPVESDFEEAENEFEETEESGSTMSSGNRVLLPWEDDEQFRAVLFIGHRLVKKNELQEKVNRICKEITFNYEGPARNVESYFNVSCGEVAGNIFAGGYVECGDVGQCVTAGAYVECGDVGQRITAGAYVECGDVGEGVTAGAYVECGDVGGSVKAGSYVECGDVEGDVSAEGNVSCGDVEGDVSAEGNVSCGDVEGDVKASGDVECGDIGGR